MKHFRSTSTKLTANSTGDLLAENHILKEEIIKLRKTSKNFEDLLIDQFIKLGEQLTINKPGFIFEDPQQCLTYFLDVFQYNVRRKRELQEVCKLITKQNMDLFEKLANQDSFEEKLRCVNEEYSKKVEELEQKLRQVQAKLQITMKESMEKQRELSKQITDLHAQKQKVKSEVQIQFLEQRKQLLDKTKKQMARYRAQIDTQIFTKQKQVKYELDKRDKEVKGLLQSIGQFLEKQDKSKSKQKKDNSPREQPTSDQIDVLNSVMKPFTQHTQLLQKQGQLRKQNLSLKNEVRRLSAISSQLEMMKAEKLNEVRLLQQKIHYYKRQLQKNKEEFMYVAEQLIQCKQDKKVMQKYYDQRWNTEINSLKAKLQKKYSNKIVLVEQEYHTMKQELNLQRQRIQGQIVSMQKQVQRSQQTIKQLNTIINHKSLTITTLQLQIKQYTDIIQENKRMGQEEILSVHLLYSDLKKTYEGKIQIIQQKVCELQKQISQIHQTHIKQVSHIKNQLYALMSNKIDEQKQKGIRLVKQKMDEMVKLAGEIQSHKKAIKDLIIQQSLKLDEVRERMEKQKQNEIRVIRVDHYEAIAKYKEKLEVLQARLQQSKDKMIDRQQVFEKQKLQLRSIVEDKKKKIEEQQKVIKQKKTQINKLEDAHLQLKQNINDLKQLYQSLQVQRNSLKLIIADKQEKIKQLISNQQNWILNIEECKRQFTQGFKELKMINDKKVAYYKSRIWQLQRNCQSGGISRKDYDRIRNLTEQKKKLVEEVTLKQAENLVLCQVKNYYQIKSRQSDSKLISKYELREQNKPVLVRKPNRNGLNLKKFKIQVTQDLKGFTGKQSYSIKKVSRRHRKNNQSLHQFQNSESSIEKSGGHESNIKNRVNSSVM